MNNDLFWQVIRWEVSSAALCTGFGLFAAQKLGAYS